MNDNLSSKISLINYVNLKREEQAYVLEMRNHESVRKWMFNPEKIASDDHYAFIESLKQKDTSMYFMVKDIDAVIGCINFHEIKPNESVDFGIFANPLIAYQGMGRVLEQAGCEYAFSTLNVQKIRLEVLASNARAISFYSKSGFTTVKHIVKEGFKTICMQKIRGKVSNEV